MKICFLISSLRSGGAERVVSLLANNFSQKYDVEIITWEDHISFYLLRDDVKHIKLNLQYSKEKYHNNIYFNFVRLLRLRKILKETKPDLIISFIIINNILATLASTNLGIPVLISERSALFTDKISKIWFRLRKFSYRFADLLVFQSQHAFDIAITHNIKAKKTTVIHNPIIINNNEDLVKQDVILFVGRLSKEKQVKDLIVAFKEISHLNPSYKLWIVGDGPEKERLIGLSKDLLIDDRIVFFGQQKNTDSFYRVAKIFVLPSLSEGFPNVLLEAMNFNNIVISSKYSKAIEEIISDKMNGLLYKPGDSSELSILLDKIIQDYSFYYNYTICAKDTLVKYSIDNISNEWHKNLIEIMKCNEQENG